MHARRNTTLLTRMMGGNTTDPAGRAVGSMESKMVVDPRWWLAHVEILCAGVASIPAAAGGGANNVLATRLSVLASVPQMAAVRLYCTAGNAIAIAIVAGLYKWRGWVKAHELSVDCVTPCARFGENDCRRAQSSSADPSSTTVITFECAAEGFFFFFFGTRSLASRLTSGERFVPWSSQAGPCPSE